MCTPKGRRKGGYVNGLKCVQVKKIIIFSWPAWIGKKQIFVCVEFDPFLFQRTFRILTDKDKTKPVLTN